MKHSKLLIVFFGLVLSITACHTTNKELNNCNYSSASESFKKYWKGRDSTSCIFGYYKATTPPISYFLTITDSMLCLKTRNSYFKTTNYDTIYESIVCNQESFFFGKEIKSRDFYVKKPIETYTKISIDTGFFRSGFILFPIDSNYILFYKIKDSLGNNIEMPEKENWDEFYFSYLSWGIEKKIINYYFGEAYSNYTKLQILTYKSPRKRVPVANKRKPYKLHED